MPIRNLRLRKQKEEILESKEAEKTSTPEKAAGTKPAATSDLILKELAEKKAKKAAADKAYRAKKKAEKEAAKNK